MFYLSLGNVPHKRHTQHRAPDGSLYAEELFGVEGFTGRSSLLYHLVPPTRTHRVEAVRRVKLDDADDDAHRHRLINTKALEPKGDPVSGRVPLFFNPDVVMGVARPASAMPKDTFYRNGQADEMIFVHEGTGTWDTVFGRFRYGPGDYLVSPIGTTWRLDPDSGSAQRMLWLEAPSELEPPRRYRNDYGQLLEHSPYSQRDIRTPEWVAPRDETGDYVVQVKVRDRITAYHYRHHPFDVVGWDGYLWPYVFNIGDFEPITGRVHQPPPVHQTFQARNFVVCSFVPRKFDYHPLSIPAPYNHSNINSDEVIYYVAGNFMSRRGVDISSFTLHPAGIPHGPHPGTAEASIGKEATEELAVMVDTFHPLRLTKQAAAMDDDRYPYSWLPPEDAGAEAEELARRGPEAFPD
ncbi:MAG TPA: homogentisate 1,2-dioxygenase [Candidatus Limnocylindrales bacterium]|jgi:homogentisate 1,2-dioxygenase|nr:homogentisate 1,2-dioxygenase [Candidatus Limnocylindrales bacterium]